MIVNYCQSGGESIYGEHFPSESFPHYHKKRGQVGLAHSGPNTNNSQFYITFGPAPHLDDVHSLFGEVETGLEILDLIEKAELDAERRPLNDITVVDCGVVLSIN